MLKTETTLLPSNKISSTSLALGWGVIGCAVVVCLSLAGQWGAAVGVSCVTFAFVVLIQPQLATVAVVFLIYTNAIPVATKIYGVPKIAAIGLPLLLVVPLFHQLVVRQRSIVISSVVPWIVAFILVQAVGVYVAERPDVALKFLVTSIAEGLLLFLVLTNVLRTQAALRAALWAAVVAGLFLGGLGIFQYTTGTFDRNYGGFAQVEEFNADADPDVVQEPRLAGSFGEKNRYANFILMLLPLSLCLAWTEKAKWLRRSALLVSLCIAIGVALTLSRGAAVGFCSLILAYAFLGKVRLRYLACLAMAAVVVVLSLPQYADRLQSIVDLFAWLDGSKELRQFDVAIVGRLTEMWAAWCVFLEHPIVGVGGDMFAEHFLEHADALGVQVHAVPRKAHNLYLGIAAEHGLLGLLCFGALILHVFKLMIQTRDRTEGSNPQISNIAVAFMLVFVIYLTVGMFADFAYVRFFWLMVALACVTYQIGQENCNEQSGLLPQGGEGR